MIVFKVLRISVQQISVAHMNEFSKYISDTLSCAEIRGVMIINPLGPSLHFSLFHSSLTHPIGEVLLKQGKRAEAEVIYRDLLYRNPENFEYYHKLEQCLDLREYRVCKSLVINQFVHKMCQWSPCPHTATPDVRLALYEVLQGMYLRAHVCRRIPLGFTTGED